MQDDADGLVSDGAGDVAERADVDAGDDRDILAHLDGGLLIVARHDGGTGQHLNFAHFLDGANRGREIIAHNGIKTRAGQRVHAGRRGDPLLGQAKQVGGAESAWKY